MGIHALLDLGVDPVGHSAVGHSAVGLHLGNRDIIVDAVPDRIIAADRQHLEQSAQHRHIGRCRCEGGGEVQRTHQHRKACGAGTQCADQRPAGCAAMGFPALSDARLDAIVQLLGDGRGLIVLSCLIKLFHASFTPSIDTRNFFRPVYSRVLTVLRLQPVTALISLRDRSS